MLRVLCQGISSPASGDNLPQQSVVAKQVAGEKAAVGDKKAQGPGTHTSVELVQLPTGRIVPATSEEGIRHQASEEAERAQASGQKQAQEAVPGRRMSDEVHRIWADMGLSRRAYSQSASPEPGRAR